jgi:hypothetical protein
MAVTAGTSAPYAPPSAILELIQRHRNKGLPPVVDAAVLERSGISHSIIPRTLRSLATLGLIDAQGHPTSTLEGIRLAAEGDYRSRLVEWLNAAYADVLVFADPANSSENAIRDAFRRFKPAGQQARMVTLFLGLYAAAGISAGRENGSLPRSLAPQRKPRRAVAQPVPGGTYLGQRPAGQLPEPIAGLLTKLPPEGQGWSREQRDQLLRAFGAVLDVCYPVLAAKPGEEDPPNWR